MKWTALSIIGKIDVGFSRVTQFFTWEMKVNEFSFKWEWDNRRYKGFQNNHVKCTIIFSPLKIWTCHTCHLTMDEHTFRKAAAAIILKLLSWIIHRNNGNNLSSNTVIIACFHSYLKTKAANWYSLLEDIVLTFFQKNFQTCFCTWKCCCMDRHTSCFVWFTYFSSIFNLKNNVSIQLNDIQKNLENSCTITRYSLLGSHLLLFNVTCALLVSHAL